MEAAENFVKKHLSKHGQHDTNVSEKVAPAVERETISQQQHEREQVAVDREVHQHHYHTTEQPVSHQEVLPEKHHHREVPVEKREFQYGNQQETDQRVANEAAQYKNTSTRVDGEKTHSAEPILAGEHVHHHVHETIQPVVHKQTVEPHVVHTSVPIHEVHHNEAKHHATSALPAVTMDEFKKQGGTLGGREERSEFFPGEPKKFEGDAHNGGLGLTGHGANPKNIDGQTSDNRANMASSGDRADLASSNDRANVSSAGNRTDTQPSDTSLGGSSTRSKPSLLDKLNPKKDADGDGKAGFLS